MRLQVRRRQLNSSYGNPSQRHERPHSLEFRVRSLCARRRVWQPFHQSHGALLQPGDAHAGRIFAASLPSLLGHHDDSGEHLRALYGARFPYPRSLRARDHRAAVRRRRHLFHHRERRQSARDVPHRPQAVATLEDRYRRPRRCHPGRRPHDRRRPHRQRRRHRLDALVSRRRSQRSHSPPAHHFRFRFPRYGTQAPREARGHCRHHHSVRGLSHGLQLLYYLRLLRRQGQVRQFLRDRPGTFRHHVRDGSQDQHALLLHHGRKFPAPASTRHGTARADEGAQQELGILRFRFGECDPQVHGGRTGRAGNRLDLDGPRIAQEPLRQAERH